VPDEPWMALEAAQVPVSPAPLPLSLTAETGDVEQ